MPPNPNLRAPTFPDDHPLEALRGVKIPTPIAVRRLMLRRVKWVVKRIDEMRAAGTPPGEDHIIVAELAALVAVMETFDRAHHAGISPGVDERQTER